MSEPEQAVISQHDSPSPPDGDAAGEGKGTGTVGEPMQVQPTELTEEDVRKQISELVAAKTPVTELIKLPEHVRSSIAAVKVVMPILGDFEKEEQKLLIEHFAPLRVTILPEAINMIVERLAQWHRDTEALLARDLSRERLASAARDFTDLLKQIHSSPLLPWLKMEHNLDRKECRKMLKKAPQVQTWCQRLLSPFFTVPNQTARSSSFILENWVAARKQRSYKLWKTALEEVMRQEKHKEEFKQHCVTAFDPDDRDAQPFLVGNFASKELGGGSAPAIRLVGGERNIVFQRFRMTAAKACADAPTHGFYAEFLAGLPLYSVDLPSFTKLIMQVIDRKSELFHLEQASDGQFLVLRTKGKELLRVHLVGRNAPIAVDVGEGRKALVPDWIMGFLQQKGVPSAAFRAKENGKQKLIVESILRMRGKNLQALEIDPFGQQIRQFVMEMKGKGNHKGVMELKGKLANKGKDLMRILQQAHQESTAAASVTTGETAAQQPAKGPVVYALKGKGKSKDEIGVILPQVLSNDAVCSMLIQQYEAEQGSNPPPDPLADHPYGQPDGPPTDFTIDNPAATMNTGVNGAARPGEGSMADRDAMGGAGAAADGGANKPATSILGRKFQMNLGGTTANNNAAATSNVVNPLDPSNSMHQLGGQMQSGGATGSNDMGRGAGQLNGGGLLMDGTVGTGAAASSSAPANPYQNYGAATANPNLPNAMLVQQPGGAGVGAVGAGGPGGPAGGGPGGTTAGANLPTVGSASSGSSADFNAGGAGGKKEAPKKVEDFFELPGTAEEEKKVGITLGLGGGAAAKSKPKNWPFFQATGTAGGSDKEKDIGINDGGGIALGGFRKKRKIQWDNAAFLRAVVAAGLQAGDHAWSREWHSACAAHEGGIIPTTVLDVPVAVLQTFVERHLFEAYRAGWADEILYLGKGEADDAPPPKKLLQNYVVDATREAANRGFRELSDSDDENIDGAGHPGRAVGHENSGGEGNKPQQEINGQRPPKKPLPQLSVLGLGAGGSPAPGSAPGDRIVNGGGPPEVVVNGGVPVASQQPPGVAIAYHQANNEAHRRGGGIATKGLTQVGMMVTIGRPEPTGNTVPTAANAQVVYMEGANMTGFTDEQPPYPGSAEETLLVRKRQRILTKLKNRRLKRQADADEEANGSGEDKKKKRKRRIHLTMLGFSDQDEHRGESTDEEELMGDGPTYHWKTRVCFSYEHGKCDKGKTCHFAHSDRELKEPGQARAEWEEKLRKRGVVPPALIPQGGMSGQPTGEGLVPIEQAAMGYLDAWGKDAWGNYPGKMGGGKGMMMKGVPFGGKKGMAKKGMDALTAAMASQVSAAMPPHLPGAPPDHESQLVSAFQPPGPGDGAASSALVGAPHLQTGTTPAAGPGGAAGGAAAEDKKTKVKKEKKEKKKKKKEIDDEEL
eukprot:g1539.t1